MGELSQFTVPKSLFSEGLEVTADENSHTWMLNSGSQMLCRIQHSHGGFRL